MYFCIIIKSVIQFLDYPDQKAPTFSPPKEFYFANSAASLDGIFTKSVIYIYDTIFFFTYPSGKKH